MPKKTLGIVGKGALIRHFFGHLKETAQSHLSSQGHLEEGHLKENPEESPDENLFFDQVGRILFYSSGYRSPADYEQSPGFNIIKKSLEQLVQVEPFQPGKSSSGIQLGAVKDFDSFCGYADVIVDVSEGYKPGSLPAGNYQQDSLLWYAHTSFLQQHSPQNKLDSPQNELNWLADYNNYLAGEQSKNEAGRISLTKESFEQHWNAAFELVNTIEKVHQKYPLGMRMLEYFPFSAMMMKQRGQQLQHYVQKNPRRVNLPTYINLVNEPCMTSLILATCCPAIAPYLVASTGYDRDRLETMLNDHPDIIAAKERAGLADFKIKIHSIAGTHDTHLMVPVHASPQIEDQEKIAAIFRNFNFASLTHFMERAMGQYWSDYNQNTGKVERRDVNKEVDRSLFETIVTALQSRGKPLSLFPKEKKTLNNGYFRVLSTDEKEGLFLTGSHRFHNGKVQGVPLKMPVKAVREFVAMEEARVVNRLREVRAALPAVYSVEVNHPSRPVSLASAASATSPNSDHSLISAASTISTAPTASPISSSSPNPLLEQSLLEQPLLEKLCFISIDKSVQKLQQTDGRWTLHPLSLPEHKYSSLCAFQVEGQLYLAAGHLRGIEIINLKNDEKKSISVQLPLQSHSSVRDIQVMGQYSGLGILVASHSSAGLLYVPLEKLLEAEHLQVEPLHADLIKNGNIQEPLRSKIHQQKIYMSKGNKVYELHDHERVELFSLPLVITALDVDAKGNIFTGTFAQNIYQSDTLIYHPSHQDPPSYIAQLQACSHHGDEGVLFRTGRVNIQSGILQFTNAAQDAAEAKEVFNEGAQNPLVGFAYSEQTLFCAQKNRLFIQDAKKEQIISIDGKVRCVKIYGG